MDEEKLDVARVRPVGDMVLVRIIHDEDERPEGQLLDVAKAWKPPATIRAVVLKCGPLVVAVNPGDRVLLDRTMYNEEVKFALVKEDSKSKRSAILAVVEPS